MLLGERLSSGQLAGAGLVLAAIALATGLFGRIVAARTRAGRTPDPDLPQGPNEGSAATR